MSWFDKVISFFSRREKVNLLDSTANLLQIIPSRDFYSDQQLIPGLASSPDKNKKVTSRGLTYFNTHGGSYEWVEPQYDHVEIEIIHDIESYVARATRAKLALFLKEGYEFVGDNDDRVEYIRTRISQIERTSRIPFAILLLQTCRDLVLHSNAFWLKVRDLKASGGKIRLIGSKKLLPTAGYFRLAPETMIPEIDGSGNITRWKQSIGGEEKIFQLDDIVHFYTNKKGGYPLGVPSIVPVIDDIRALRSLEHNIDVLIHKHLFPIVLWKVGTDIRPAQTYPDGQTEIDVVREAVANMPTEGSLVVSERYDVNAIGAENKALRVETYLAHYRERLLAGLDVSSIDVGIGNSSSRSTAQTLSRNLMDTVKLHQVVIQELIQFVINELLLESTFQEDLVLSSENLVYLRFREIDKEAKQAEDNHYVDLFTKNAISYSEMRYGIGYEVLTPEEEKELYWNKFGKEIALTKPTLSNESDRTVANKTQPANQHGTRTSPKLNKDAYANSSKEEINPILLWHKRIGTELQARWSTQKNLLLAEADIRTSYQLAKESFISIIGRKIRSNYPDPFISRSLTKYMEERIDSSINKLVNELIRRIKADQETPNIIFESLKYRTILIFDTELAYADNLSIYRWYAINKIDMKIVSSGKPCNICKPKLTSIKWNDKLGEVNIPPYHPLCTCRVVAVEG